MSTWLRYSIRLHVAKARRIPVSVQERFVTELAKLHTKNEQRVASARYRIRVASLFRILSLRVEISAACGAIAAKAGIRGMDAGLRWHDKYAAACREDVDLHWLSLELA